MEGSYRGTFFSFQDILAVTSCVTINGSPCFLQLLFQVGSLKRVFSKGAKLVCFPPGLLGSVLCGNKVPFHLERYSELLYLGGVASMYFLYLFTLKTDNKRTSSLTFGQLAKSTTSATPATAVTFLSMFSSKQSHPRRDKKSSLACVGNGAQSGNAACSPST